MDCYKAEKVQFAEFVSMTNEEYNSLVTEFGEQGAKRCIEILDNYKGAKGRKYANDYRAIRSWVIKRYKEEKYETHNHPQLAAETTNADKVDRKTLEKKYGNSAVSKYEAKFDSWSSKHGSVNVEKYSEIAKWMAKDGVPEAPESYSSFDVDEVMNKIYAKYREDG